MARLQHSTERGRETQRDLRAALLALILEKGFERVTVRDITERAGVDRTTFYLHYAGKRELFEESQRQVIDDLAAPGVAGDGDGVLRAFRHMAAHATAYRALLAIGDPAIDARLHDYAAGQIAVALRERAGAGPAGPPLDLLAHYAASALRGIAKWWLEAGMPYSPEEMASVFRRLLAGGLAAFGAGSAATE